MKNYLKKNTLVKYPGRLQAELAAMAHWPRVVRRMVPFARAHAERVVGMHWVYHMMN